MQLHEYQAKACFRRAGIHTQEGILVRSVGEVDQALGQLSLPVVVKAQVHAGGRGKAGAIRICKTADEVQAACADILGMILKTKQTGPSGVEVKSVYLEQASDIANELYCSILTDRDSQGPVLIASSEGGMDIEETAETNPAAIVKLPIDPARGITDHQCRTVHFAWTDGSFNIKQTTALLKSLFQVYATEDATMVEVNPVAVTPDGELIALDAKMSVDDNARFRHAEWDGIEHKDERDAREVEAESFGLNYIKIEDGSIGCMVNGAGLAMATMDVITLFGARPANFLDVGGGATVENVTAAFRILASDPDVKAILVNIFGGIMKCDVIAEGIITASKNVSLDVPLIVRLEGTNVEQGRQMIADSGLGCQTAADLSEAARLAVDAAKEK